VAGELAAVEQVMDALAGDAEHGRGHRDRDRAGSSTPVKVPGLRGSSVIKLVAAFANSGALLSNGEYFDWGYDAGGQLGNCPPAGHPTSRSG
jgi:hypothetical protein